jgi:hypothetical protein
MDTLLLVEEVAEPLSVRCHETDRVSISPRFSVRLGWCLLCHRPDVEELLRNIDVARNGYAS